MYTQVTLVPLPEQLQPGNCSVNVAFTAIPWYIVDRKVRVEALMLSVPGGLVTVLPVLVNPP